MVQNPLSTLSGKSKLNFCIAFLFFSLVPIVYTLYSIPETSNVAIFIKDTAPFWKLNYMNFLKAIKLCKGIFISFAITQMLHYLGGIFAARFLSETNKNIKSELFQKVQRMPMSFFLKWSETDIERNISSYADSFCRIAEICFFYIIPAQSTIFSTLFNSARTSLKDFIFYCGWLIICYFIMKHQLKKIIKMDENLFSSRRKSSSFCNDLYKNILVEKSFQIQSNTYIKFLRFQEKEETDYKNSIYENNKQKSYVGILTNSIFILYVLFNIFFSSETGAVMFKNYNIACYFNLYIWKVFASVLPLFFHFGILSKTRQFFDQSEQKEKDIIVDHPSKIEVKSLSYKVGNKKILDGISFSIDHQVLLIKGASGSGKSTLVSIISGILDCEPGQVFINGVDITKLNKKALLKNISFLTQNSFILNDSIKNNIIIANLNYTEEQLDYAIETSRVVEFTNNNVHELERICGPSGSMISGGQAKRISMARLLIRDIKDNLVILDEPFAHLDKELIEFFKSLILKFKQEKRTIVIIDHTDKCDDFADQILDLKDGSISEISE